jgi:hypothetical protein
MMDGKTNVLFVDDHAAVKTGYKILLSFSEILDKSMKQIAVKQPVNHILSRSQTL